MSSHLLRFTCGVSACVITATFSSPALAARPIPLGTAHTTVEYHDGISNVTIMGDRSFNGVGPVSATLMGGNVKSFNSQNAFGRRTALANTQPMFADVLGPNETLISHAFFKNDLAGDYLPGVTDGDGDITFTFSGMVFDQPVTVIRPTFMLHTLWNLDQVAELDTLYSGPGAHNHHTDSNPFRDFDDFLAGGTFSDFPADNFTLATVEPLFLGDGTPGAPLSMTVTIPYSIFINLEEDPQNPQMVPEGLPGPGGFLEPFHFHFEYVVVPEPSTLALLSVGLLLARRRANRKKSVHNAGQRPHTDQLIPSQTATRWNSDSIW